MKFKIKNVSDHFNPDLRNYANEIKAGVSDIFPNSIVNVYTKYFEVLNVSSPNNFLLREMGRLITRYSTYLNSIKKTYGNSTQVFIQF